MEEKNYKKGKENFVDNGYVFYLGSGNRFMDIYIYISPNIQLYTLNIGSILRINHTPVDQ